MDWYVECKANNFAPPPKKKQQQQQQQQIYTAII